MVKNFTKNGVRLPKLENNPNIVVILPELIELTRNFIDELIKFIDFICKNDFIASILRTKSTIDDYYKELIEFVEKIEVQPINDAVELESKELLNDI